MKTTPCTLLLVASLALPVAANGIDKTEAKQKLEQFMNRAAEEGFTGAVIVAVGDDVLLERGYGRLDPDDERPVLADSVFTTGSITKQFTAAAVLELEETKKLSVSDPIAKYFEEVPEDKKSITIHQLLSHTAGFPPAIGDDFERVGRGEYVKRALASELLFAPGTGYEYSNVGFSLAAAIVEIASGKPYEEFLHEHLFVPAGMKDTGYHMPRWEPARLAHGVRDDGGDWGTPVDRVFSNGGPGWHLLGNGGIHSTVGDMLRWHRALEGDRILSAASKKKMYERHADEGGGTWYGYGWSIEPTPWGELITHNGGNPFYFSDFLRFRDDDVVIYYSTTSRDRRMRRLARKLARIVFTGEMPELEPEPGPLLEPGQGPAAPEGSLAAKWRFPGSFQGMRAAEFLEAVIQGHETLRKSLIDAGFAPGVIERNGVEGLMRLFDSLREEIGGDYEVRGLRLAGETRIAIVIDRRGRPAPIQLILDLEPDEPHRITGIAVEVGE